MRGSRIFALLGGLHSPCTVVLVPLIIVDMPRHYPCNAHCSWESMQLWVWYGLCMTFVPGRKWPGVRWGSYFVRGTFYRIIFSLAMEYQSTYLDRHDLVLLLICGLHRAQPIGKNLELSGLGNFIGTLSRQPNCPGGYHELRHVNNSLWYFYLLKTRKTSKLSKKRNV